MVYLKLFVVVLKMLLFVSLNQLSTEWKGKSTFDTVPTLGLGGYLSRAQRLLINPGQSRSRDGISPVGTGKTEDMFVSPLAACATVGLEGELN